MPVERKQSQVYGSIPTPDHALDQNALLRMSIQENDDAHYATENNDDYDSEGGGLMDDTDSLDDDVLRSVDAFSSSDEDDDDVIRNDLLSFHMDTEALSPRNSKQLSSRKASVDDFEFKRDRARSMGSILKLSFKSNRGKAIQSRAQSVMSRTDLKLLEKGDQPMKGMIYYIVYTILYSLCFLCAKYLYDRNPDLNPFQMLMLRSGFALLFQLIIVNKELKKAVWDGVDKKSAGPLVFRSIQGTMTNIINYSVTKYLPLTMIAIVNNMGPLVTLVLAYLILKERIKRFEILMIVLTVAGVLVVVIFADPNASDSSTTTTSTTFKYVLYGCLFCNPILVAGGSISMRKMKKFHEAVVSFYLNWSIGLTSLVMVLALGLDFKVIAQFDWVSWLLSVGTGLTALTSQTCRFIALKLQKASKL